MSVKNGSTHKKFLKGNFIVVNGIQTVLHLNENNLLFKNSHMELKYCYTS